MVQLPWPNSPDGSPGPNYVAYVFLFLGSTITCCSYKLALSQQAQVTLQLLNQSFSFSVKIFSLSAFAGGPKQIFSLGPEPTLGSPRDKCYKIVYSQVN